MALASIVTFPLCLEARQPPRGGVEMRSPQPPPKGPDPIEKLGNGLFALGSLRVDTNKKEVTVPGFVNDVPILEFLVNTKGGFKNYESAIEADTNAITFNVALLLIGLDTAGSAAPPVDRGPEPPRGQQVDVLVQWQEGDRARSVPAEELIMIGPTRTTLPKAPWIYTGSVLMKEQNALIADMDGILIGFMHTRASLIDHGARLEHSYGAYVLNTDVIKPGTKVTVVVRARGAKK